MLKKPSMVIESNGALPRPPLSHVPKCHICTSFKSLRGWWLLHCPGQPVPMPDNLVGQETFPNIQSKPPGATWGHFLLSCFFLPGRTDSLQPHYNLLSGSWETNMWGICIWKQPNQMQRTDFWKITIQSSVSSCLGFLINICKKL